MNNLEGMALVCTAAVNGTCILYEFKPIEEARIIAKKTMGENIQEEYPQ